MTKILAIGNHKGGVAKTTTTANVGAILAKKGYKTLLVDLDAQANLTTYYLPPKPEPESTIYNAMTEEEGTLPIIKVKDNLDIVPSSIMMANIETAITANVDKNFILKDLIEEVAPKYDFILLDCPPSLGVVTINALVAATSLYITTTAEAIPTKGLGMLLKLIPVLQKRQNPNLSLSGIIITRWGGRNLNKDIEESLRAKFKELVLTTKVRENISIAEAAFTLKDIVSYSPQSNGAKDYIALTEEILAKEKY